MIPRQEEGVVWAQRDSRAAFKTDEPVMEITGLFWSCGKINSKTHGHVEDSITVAPILGWAHLIRLE
jgi:hypothetical protein